MEDLTDCPPLAIERWGAAEDALNEVAPGWIKDGSATRVSEDAAAAIRGLGAKIAEQEKKIAALQDGITFYQNFYSDVTAALTNAHGGVPAGWSNPGSPTSVREDAVVAIVSLAERAKEADWVTKDQAKAWLQVAAVLRETCAGWTRDNGTGADCAERAIRNLAAKASRKFGVKEADEILKGLACWAMNYNAERFGMPVGNPVELEKGRQIVLSVLNK